MQGGQAREGRGTKSQVAGLGWCLREDAAPAPHATYAVADLLCQPIPPMEEGGLGPVRSLDTN